MVIRGRVENGVVVPEGDIPLPEGAEVTIAVASAANRVRSEMSAQQRERMMAALERIRAVDDENPLDDFSGADHDRELYGAP